MLQDANFNSLDVGHFYLCVSFGVDFSCTEFFIWGSGNKERKFSCHFCSYLRYVRLPFIATWYGICHCFQYFDHVEEAEWAVEVLRTAGKPVMATLCIGPRGDIDGVPAGECAVRLANAGMV